MKLNLDQSHQAWESILSYLEPYEANFNLVDAYAIHDTCDAIRELLKDEARWPVSYLIIKEEKFTRLHSLRLNLL